MHTWSKIRFKLEKEYLAPSLRGRIQYYAVSYSKSPDHNGRAAVRLDGREILASGYWDAYPAFFEAFRENTKGYDPLDNEKYREACRKSNLSAIEKGAFDENDLYRAFNEFDNQSIEKSLESENALVRMFAIFDRRIGKRRLAKLAERIGNEPAWLVRLYRIRLEVEGVALKMPSR